uniref:Endoplasmic oxidoreductin n=2 Tax=Macrostomum lignano TaxID=282301 RepID=A0A1I8GFA8_9PLAT
MLLMTVLTEGFVCIKSRMLMKFCVLIIVSAISLLTLCRDCECIDVNNPLECFKLLNGPVDDCACELKSVAEFNNRILYPRLQALLKRNYFRYVRVNLKAKCPFWEANWLCAMRHCHVDGCQNDEVPPGMRDVKSMSDDAANCPSSQSAGDQVPAGSDSNLGELDETLSPTSQAAFVKWSDHDDSLLQFCEWDDDIGNSSQYVDLLRNPERYTGYRGEAAHKIWRSIYEENCFNDPASALLPGGAQMRTVAQSQCLEIRVYHRLISGLHTSINTHLSHKYLLLGPQDRLMGTQNWGPNVTEFLVRFHPEFEPQGPVRLKNLHFTFLAELRALAKAAPVLRRAKFFTGSESDDAEVAQLVSDILDQVEQFPDHFDESQLFRERDKIRLKSEIREKFFNITRIMDCVGCDKCRLWGKVQTAGLGTALKVLFSPNLPQYLRRHEIVTLFNALGRLSESIYSLEEFKGLLSSNGWAASGRGFRVDL